MMMVRLVSLVFGVVSLMGSGVGSAEPASERKGRIKFIHAVPGAPKVNALLNDRKVFSEIWPLYASDFASVEGTVVEFSLNASSDDSTVLKPVKIDVPAGQDVIVVAHAKPGDPKSVAVSTYAYEAKAPGKGNARVVLFHAVADGEAVSGLVNGDPLAKGLKPGSGAGPFEFKASEGLKVTFKGEEKPLADATAAVSDGGLVVALFSGTAEENDEHGLQVSLLPDQTPADKK